MARAQNGGISKMDLEQLEQKAKSLQKEGHFKASLPYVKESLKFKQAIKTDREYAIALGELGALYERIADFTNARLTYIQAIKLMKAGTFSEDPHLTQLESKLTSLNHHIEEAKKNSVSTSPFKPYLSASAEKGNSGWIYLLVLEVGFLILVAVMVQRYRRSKSKEDE